MAKALEEPLKQIAENAGIEGGVVVERVKDMSGSEGLNAATGDYEDLVKVGVIDAAKVTRSALQNAASIAALFLTTEAVIADKPEKDAPRHARWRHGGLLGLRRHPPLRCGGSYSLRSAMPRASLRCARQCSSRTHRAGQHPHSLHVEGPVLRDRPSSRA